MENMTVRKLGVGSDDDPIRPDTTAKWWQVVTERDTEFDIEIIEQ
jgi:hypothetical protein